MRSKSFLVRVGLYAVSIARALVVSEVVLRARETDERSDGPTSGGAR